MMFVILLFMFQFTGVMKEQLSEYESNEYADDTTTSFQRSDAFLAEQTSDDACEVIYVGEAGGAEESVVKTWCSYRKRTFFCSSSLALLDSLQDDALQVLVVDGSKVTSEEEVAVLRREAQMGVTVIFATLPQSSVIREYRDLRELLGIRAVIADEIPLAGMHLFSGFLLGGEEIYEVTELGEEERQDMNPSVPWYTTGAGTKTYMVGLLDQSKQKETVENEELPTLIWRNGIRNGSIFCVVGDYMKDSTALGLLDGMVAEASSYYIYPVVNVQNLSMINFPVFADENNEQMMELYSQSITGMARDIMWPSLISIVEKGGLKMTCFMQPQTNYKDGIEPTSRDLVFYLKQMKEQNAEAGLSLQYKNAESLRDKLNQDAEFFRKADSSYKYGAAYTEEKDLDTVKALMNTELMKNVSTLVCEYTEDEPVISYCTDSVTLQSVTSDGMNYTYSDDIRMRSIQSSLGYTNVMLNMQKIFWPERKKDRWQIMQKRFSSNLLTYWKNFTGFDSTTLSESNTRTRTFLNLDFSETRTDDEIILKTSESGSWFILRTHGEEIEEIEGGTQKKLEDNVYLIQAQDTTVKIQVKTAGLHYSK